jgi:hypothetical protein
MPRTRLAIAAVLLLAAAVVVRELLRRGGLYAGFWRFTDDLPDAEPQETEAGRALQAVMAFAGGNDDFRRAWDHAVGEVADYVAARVAGAWMAGAASPGGIPVSWQGSIAVPAAPGICEEHTNAAFQLAVTGEVNRRISGMHGPGAFG